MLKIEYIAQDYHYIRMDDDDSFDPIIDAELTDAEMRQLFRSLCRYYGEGNI